MNKTDLINVVAQETELKKKDVEAIVNASLDAIAAALKEGDKVITGKYSGTEVKLDGTDYTIVSQSDILAVVEE